MHIFWFIGLIFVLMIGGGVALVAFLIMRTQSEPTAPVRFPGTAETPLQILDRRFASGEITAEEYQKARDLLAGSGRK